MNAVSDKNGILTIKWRGRPLAVLLSLAGAAAWGAVFAVLLIKFQEPDSPLPAIFWISSVFCVLGVMAGLFFTAQLIYGCRAVFDSQNRAIAINCLTGKRFTANFESMARVAPVEEETLFSAYTAFCVVPKLSPVFGVKVISGPLKPKSEKRADFERRVLPDIERMIGAAWEKKKVENDQILPPAHYSKDDYRYVRNFSDGFIFDISCAILYSLPAAVVFWAFDELTGAFSYVNPSLFIQISAITAIYALYHLAVFLFFRQRSVTFDPLSRETRVKHGFWRWGAVRVYPFSSVKSFEVFWRAGLGVNSQRRDISLVIDGTEKTVRMISRGKQGKALSDEMRFLAALFGLDPVRDITYKRGIINIFADWLGVM